MGMPDHNKLVVIKGKWVLKKTMAGQYSRAYLVMNALLGSLESRKQVEYEQYRSVDLKILYLINIGSI